MCVQDLGNIGQKATLLGVMSCHHSTAEGTALAVGSRICSRALIMDCGVNYMT